MSLSMGSFYLSPMLWRSHITQEHTPKEKRPPYSGGLSIIRHRAIFPGFDDPSIVTAERLNCCVRYGNRCFPLAMGTEVAGLAVKVRQLIRSIGVHSVPIWSSN